MMIKIAPSILSADFARLRDEIQRVEQDADWLHVDVMDGHFVPNLTIGPPVVRSIKKYTKLPLDVHLMMTNPDDFIPLFAESGANSLTVHVETCPHLHRTVQEIKKRGMSAGISLNPATSLALLDETLAEVDMILIMTVNPGFGGQNFLPEAADKVARIRRMAEGRDIRIEVDGGITPETAPAVIAAGADVLVAGSSVFRGGPSAYAANIAALRAEPGRKDDA